MYAQRPQQQTRHNMRENGQKPDLKINPSLSGCLQSVIIYNLLLLLCAIWSKNCNHLTRKLISLNGAYFVDVINCLVMAIVGPSHYNKGQAKEGKQRLSNDRITKSERPKLNTDITASCEYLNCTEKMCNYFWLRIFWWQAEITASKNV